MTIAALYVQATDRQGSGKQDAGRVSGRADIPRTKRRGERDTMKTDVGIYSVTTDEARYYIAARSVDHALSLWREVVAADTHDAEPVVSRIPIAETASILIAAPPVPTHCPHCMGTGVEYAPQETLRGLWDDFQEMGRPWGTGDVLWSSKGLM